MAMYEVQALVTQKLVELWPKTKLTHENNIFLNVISNVCLFFFFFLTNPQEKFISLKAYFIWWYSVQFIILLINIILR